MADNEKKPIILCVDDEPNNLTLLEAHLAPRGYEIVAVDNGADALKALSGQDIDLVILDVMMPKLSGFDVLRRIRQDEKTRFTPVVLVTALKAAEDRVRGVEAGCDDFISKPFNKDELLTRIKSLLRISEYRTHLEERVRERTAELSQANDALQKAYDDIKRTQLQLVMSEKLASIGLLSAGIAHEINNPLACIISNLGSLEEYLKKLEAFIGEVQEAALSHTIDATLETLQKKYKTADIMADIPKIIPEMREEADRIKTIVQDFKMYARDDGDKVGPVDIPECIEKALNLAKSEIKYKAEVIKEIGELPRVTGNYQQMLQVFINLLVNGAQAIEKYGKITVKACRQDETVMIEIRDTGCGIPEENIARIFEPLFTTKEVGKGTGLGLWIVRGIVQQHNGEIQVQSKVGEGTSFIIKLPG